MQDEFIRLQSVLKKTIVFITHDFDEAIRLADRIAIMKDGEIVQAGSPEEIVLHPATPYVAEFTGSVPKAKVVKAGSLAKPVNGAALPEHAVADNRPIAEAAGAFSDGATALRVTRADGSTVGILHRADVIDIMLRS